MGGRLSCCLSFIRQKEPQQSVNLSTQETKEKVPVLLILKEQGAPSISKEKQVIVDIPSEESIRRAESIQRKEQEELKKEVNDLDRKLQALNLHTVQKYSLKGWTGRIRVSRVIDGDTVCVVFYVRKNDAKPREAHLRFAGLDTPELHPRLSSKYHDSEKEAGLKAKLEMIRLVQANNELFDMVLDGEDKYGRLLGRLIGKEGDISKYMIDNGFGISYDGRKKKEFEDWYFVRHPSITKPLFNKMSFNDKEKLKSSNDYNSKEEDDHEIVDIEEDHEVNWLEGNNEISPT